MAYNRGSGSGALDAGSAADELTGLAAAAGAAAASEAHSHTHQQHQLLQLQMQSAAQQLDPRAKEFMNAHMPTLSHGSVGDGARGGLGLPQGAAGQQEPMPATRKRRQSQARLTQNAEAQKRYRYPPLPQCTAPRTTP